MTAYRAGMKTGIPVALWKTFPIGLSSLAFGFPKTTWAANSSTDTSIGTTLCTAAGWMTGNVGVGLAVCGVIILGILAIFGKISWGMGLLAGTGIATIFGAGAVVVALGGGSCTSATGGNGPGPTGPTGPPPSSYINLTTSGIVTPSLSFSHWPAGQTYNSGSQLTINTPFNPPTPVVGWLQMVITGLPPGTMTLMGTDANGNPFYNMGFYNISGDGQHPITNGMGISLPPNMTSLPSGVSVQYKLYNSFSDYSQGCVTSLCSFSSQTQHTWSTTTGSTSSTPCTGTTTSGNCVAPPL